MQSRIPFCTHIILVIFMLIEGGCNHGLKIASNIVINSLEVPIISNDFYIYGSRIKAERKDQLLFDAAISDILIDRDNFMLWLEESAMVGNRAAIVILAETYEHGYFGQSIDLHRAHSFKEMISKSNSNEHWVCCAGVNEHIENAYIMQQVYLTLSSAK